MFFIVSYSINLLYLIFSSYSGTVARALQMKTIIQTQAPSSLVESMLCPLRDLLLLEGTGEWVVSPDRRPSCPAHSQEDTESGEAWEPPPTLRYCLGAFTG